jgi:hypothetical protein
MGKGKGKEREKERNEEERKEERKKVSTLGKWAEMILWPFPSELFLK